MTYELPAAKGPVRDVALQGGYLIGFSVQALFGLFTAILRRRLSLHETVTQTLFIGRVSTGPSLLLMIPIVYSSPSRSVNWPAGSEPVDIPELS